MQTRTQPRPTFKHRGRSSSGWIDTTTNARAGTGWLPISTVKTYVSRSLTRLDRRNRAEIATLAYEWGLVDERKGQSTKVD